MAKDISEGGRLDLIGIGQIYYWIFLVTVTNLILQLRTVCYLVS
jgi:hypothetical protein